MKQKIPDRAAAEGYLEGASKLNPGPWVSHSLYVAQGAQAIASHIPGLQPERAYILGLLHDIGRRKGVAGMRHIIDGYHFLINEGYPVAARICLTHSFPVEGSSFGASPWDGAPEELQFVATYLGEIKYDDYDRLIQLCDAVSLPSGFCLMEKRLVDVVMRYGLDQYTEERWKSFFQIKEKIENSISESIYQLLPGVVENTFN